MSSVLFGQSYYLRFDPKLWAAMQPYPPLGTLYAASYVRERGHDVALFDAMLAESVDEWDASVKRERPEYAVLFEDNFNYLSKMCLSRMREAAFAMIEAARDRGCAVIVAGSDATDHADRYLAQGADYVLTGEGEETLGELLATLSGQSDRPVDEIAGLAYADPSAPDGVRRTPRRPDIRNLDALPFPAWDLVDIGRYQDLWYRRHGYYSMNMVTTRGCPYHCNWCAKPIWGQRYNARSPENVVDELAWLKSTFRPDHIWFADDIMGLKPHWLDRYATLVETRDARVPFKSLHRADLLLRGDTVGALKRAGAQIVWIGAESGSQHVLDDMDKGTKVEQIYEAAARLHDAGIRVGFFLQFGYPGETRADIDKTLQMVRDCRPDDIGASVSYPLPGTAFFERVRRDLGEKQNWVDSADLAMLYRGPFPTEFYRALHVVLHKEFRARKALTELRGVLTRPWTVRPVHARRAAGMIHHLATLPFARRTMDRLAVPLAPDSRSLSEEETRRAFDAVAANYDGPLGNNALIQQMRAHLWQEVDRRVPAGGKLLDLGCGTGIDAIHFGQQGYHVTAIDLSPNMVERTRRRAEADGVGQRVHAHVLSLRELRSAPESEFDCIYSDLGPLNCADDLGEVAAACATLLRPGGVFVASVIGRICPWEIGLYLARRQVRRALLRFRTGLIAVPLQGETVWTRYYTPGEMKRLFSPWFDTSICRALGLFSPPPYLVKAYDSRPRLGRLLTRMDDRVGTWPVFREMGDHFLVVLTKRA